MPETAPEVSPDDTAWLCSAGHRRTERLATADPIASGRLRGHLPIDSAGDADGGSLQLWDEPPDGETGRH